MFQETMNTCNIPLMPKDPKLAYAYIAFQPCDFKTFEVAEGFDKGTIFPALYRPIEENGGAE